MEQKNKTKIKSLDVIFLEKKLQDYVNNEEYEKAAVVKRWIEELSGKSK